jgi:hypothetical protein
MEVQCHHSVSLLPMPSLSLEERVVILESRVVALLDRSDLLLD